MFFTEACNTLSKILPRGPRKDRNFPYKPQVLGYNLLLINILGPCWGLGTQHALDHDVKMSQSEHTQHRVIWQHVGRVREGPCQPLVGLSSISLAGLSSSSSPLSERITLPCQVRKSIPSPAGQTASQTCVYFLGWHTQPIVRLGSTAGFGKWYFPGCSRLWTIASIRIKEECFLSLYAGECSRVRKRF